ncbi:fatty-acyl-CoA synthase [Tistlia consotensis]|uniref:3-methylmercaptopropionyl-CoA ligase n=1 Tax=Tistlia consotensis USBA 355 TaxID=560819 RepID=A0A1Y6BXS1_9PROT|nr:acyl-CoA synthetase [Tistlia consotensis]SMF25221.1 fatty-acyl-CoA synthase [Tistlia consotensis USBA 355]SNR59776.1 fatty-acyl-CoA synthase [Tistlia consotensis]
MASSIYDLDLDRTAANHAALTPLSFLKRAAAVYPNKPAVIHDRVISYRQFGERVRRLASALEGRGLGPGDTVAVMAPNVPALLEAHYGVPLMGGVLNALNIRLDAATIAFILQHGGAKVLITDREFAPTIERALAQLETRPLVIDIDDPLTEAQKGVKGPLLGALDYEAFLAEGDPERPWTLPEDEWQAICLNYTSGTTGNPKGVVYHHRGAFLNAMGNAISMGLTRDSVYLWTLPMFHCNGWTFTWAVTAMAGIHVCLRRVDPELIYPLIESQGVTHLCGAPIVLNLLAHAPDSLRKPLPHPIKVVTGGAAPPSTVIANMERQGFQITHMYGLTECYGPATLCAWQDEWNDLDLEGRASKMARQGVKLVTLHDCTVRDPDSLEEVPHDGETLGELMLRGNTVMKGYLKNPTATAQAFAGGWFRTGDLGVVHPDGYIEVKDRSKDVIISGGENISSLEVEEVLYRHPKVLEAAVVARPDEKWGESPCAFVTLKTGASASEEEIVAFCRDNLARYKVPKTVVFAELPKTSTGKIQKFVLREQAAALPGTGA